MTGTPRDYTPVPAEAIEALHQGDGSLGEKAKISVGTCRDPSYYGEMAAPADVSEGDTVALRAAESRRGGGTRYNGAHPTRAGTVRQASDENVVIDTAGGSTVVVSLEGRRTTLRTDEASYVLTHFIRAEFER